MTTTFVPPSACVREVYRVRFPLDGLPAWSPKVHAAVAVAAICINQVANENVAHAAVAAGGAHIPFMRTALLLDMLPVKPRDPFVLASLIAGRHACAFVRAKSVPWPLPKRLSASVSRAGFTSLSDTQIFSFNSTCSKNFRLYTSNCYSYEQKLLHYLLNSGESELETLKMAKLAENQ